MLPLLLPYNSHSYCLPADVLEGPRVVAGPHHLIKVVIKRKNNNNNNNNNDYTYIYIYVY